jgi:hypothetical protein
MARSRAAGRVDLRFAGGEGWALGVELKLNSDFGDKQIERYCKVGPVAVVVRSLDDVPGLKRLAVNPNWVGAATWQALLPSLRDLPVNPTWARDWMSLLDVMEDDGEFATSAPSAPEVEAQGDLLEVLAPKLRDRLEGALQNLYGDVSEALDLRCTSIRRGGRTWTSFGLQASDGPWLWVGIRNLWTHHPRLWIDYYPLTDWRAKRRLGQAHQRIGRARFESYRDYYRFDEPVDALAGATPDQYAEALQAIWAVINKLVRCRVFDVEVERLHG